MKAKKVFKYATGEAIPEGAVYLSTQVEKVIQLQLENRIPLRYIEKNALVWHYFLVEVDA